MCSLLKSCRFIGSASRLLPQGLSVVRPSLAAPVFLAKSSLYSAYRSRPTSRSASAGSASSTPVVVSSPLRASTMTVPEKPVEKFRKDYAPPPYLIPSINLDFNLEEESTTVVSRMRLTPHHGTSEPVALVLNGHEDVKLEGLEINGKEVDSASYVLSPQELAVQPSVIPPGEWELEITTRIRPQDNTALEGLYKSGAMFCSQCEAEGFRHITFFLDRPDVMAKYTTRIEADKSSYPVLLSNGNLIDQGTVENGARHFTVWEDPFAKPCYLFALVAGDLAVREDSFRTASGRDVALRFYTDAHNADKTAHAIESLKRAMKWDEERYGLEYDLDLFNVVAVDDFNMGAMENKSLNLFNSRLVLATPASATDTDFARIEGVVGHEYFHNWTGNRVTCRDWFQLTLKEGLTVYRDQEFSADLNSAPVKRIEDVARLRMAQFPEDAGPQAHAIRPDSYIKMDNFYTTTVYEKGAEVVRLYEALLGRDGFRAGLDLYFKRHDGQAVTCDDFLAAMADANGQDLSGLSRWYSQAGTPELNVSTIYDEKLHTLTLTATQCTPSTRGQPAESKLPLLIPIRMGLLQSSDGKPLPLHLRSIDGTPCALLDSEPRPTEDVLRLESEKQTWVFDHVPERPVVSLLRGLSAPVKLTVEDQSREDLLTLLRHDTDAFNRWEAGQRLFKAAVLEVYSKTLQQNKEEQECSSKDAKISADNSSPTNIAVIDVALLDGLRAVLNDAQLDGAFKAYVLSLPDQAELVAAVGSNADPVVLHQAREAVANGLARGLVAELEKCLADDEESSRNVEYEYSAPACARRALKNTSLSYLTRLDENSPTNLLLSDRLEKATNMTDEIAALSALCRTAGPARTAALAAFYEKWKTEPLVLLKWIATQAGSNVPNNTAAVKELLTHPAVKLSNPNTCYSIFLAFARSPVNFHAADGSGYDFLAESVLTVDKINHQVAARIVGAFNNWRDVDTDRQNLMVAALRRIAGTPGISANVYELVNKALPHE